MIGRNTTTLGRWVRLLGGLLLVLLAGLSMISITDRADARGVLVSFVAILIVYEFAYLALEKPLLARRNPWLNSLVLVVPAIVIALVLFVAAILIGVDGWNALRRYRKRPLEAARADAKAA